MAWLGERNTLRLMETKTVFIPVLSQGVDSRGTEVSTLRNPGFTTETMAVSEGYLHAFAVTVGKIVDDSTSRMNPPSGLSQ